MTALNGNIKTVLFDLDGTLADTAPDMVGALNLLMREQHREPLPFEQARNHVSKGGLALVQLGFADEKDEQMLETLRLRFLDIYSENLCIGTRLFAGMPEVLDFIDA
ncbi:MAG: HAD hydrolase-like protein, partial [Gammaproteobacteria bacterium]